MTTVVHRSGTADAAVQEAWRRTARVMLLIGGGLVLAGLVALLAVALLPPESTSRVGVFFVAVAGVGCGVSVLLGDAVWLALRGLVRPRYSLRRKRALFWLTLAVSALLVVLCLVVFWIGLLALLVFPPLAVLFLLVAALIFGFGWTFTRE